MPVVSSDRKRAMRCFAPGPQASFFAGPEGDVDREHLMATRRQTSILMPGWRIFGSRQPHDWPAALTE
jgi:hypothetical protein